MATKKRPGSARRTVAQQEAARKAGAPGKRFVGETAAQSAKAKRDERKRAGRARAAARKAKPAEAARTAGARRPRAPKPSRGAAAGSRAVGPVADVTEIALRSAEEQAAAAGAEVEPLAHERPTAGPPAGPYDPHAEARRADHDAAARAVEREAFHEPSVDLSGSGDAVPPLAWALADLALSALRLARTLALAPLRLAGSLRRLPRALARF